MDNSLQIKKSNLQGKVKSVFQESQQDFINVHLYLAANHTLARILVPGKRNPKTGVEELYGRSDMLRASATCIMDSCFRTLLA